MLTSVAAEVGVKSRSFPISEIGDDAVINRADQIAEGDTIIVRKSSSKESIIQAVGGKKKFDALNINIVAPAGQNQRNLLVEGNQLYVAFSDEVDYNRYLKRYDLTQDVALVSPEEATKLTREALQLRFDEGQGADKVKAATELVMDFFEPKTFVDATQALEQYVKIGGNMLQTVLDDSALFPRWMQAPFEDVLLYSRNVLRGK
jgi:hypothetical protein